MVWAVDQDYQDDELTGTKSTLPISRRIPTLYGGNDLLPLDLSAMAYFPSGCF